MIYVILLSIFSDSRSICNTFFNELILAKVLRGGVVRSSTKQSILNRLVTIFFLRIFLLLLLIA